MRSLSLPPFLTISVACALAVPALAQIPPPAAPPPAFDVSLLAGLRARSIGPAAMSGRIGAVASVPGDPTTIWVGGASGGVWKSTDGGARFQPVFDDQDCTSIGAIAIDPHSPEVVWVGTGEGNLRNSASVGRGVYRTRDGGRTWQKLGLEHSEHIHRIALDPRNPAVAFAAALGNEWAANEERGLFRTTDGGASWTKVLYVDADTGCCDVAMDPRNPDKLFAGMWQHRRTAWDMHSGGPGSGVWRSLDGGTTWTKIAPHEGIPEGELGRSCFSICEGDPRVVYLLLEAKKSALLRSDDGGFTFRTVNQQDGIASRPFYFCDVRVDPLDSNRIYNLHIVIDASTDGGRTFQTLVGWDQAHPDHHAIWIDPQDPRRIVIGNDGGVYTSLDQGHSWRFCSNLPLGQFYHVAVDRDVPYHVYGGLQDNGSWRGPSQVWENGGIRNLHWQEVCFGDGFATLPDPQDSMQGYAMSQGGELIRWDLRTGQQKSVQPPAPIDARLRFHWNSAIAQDPFDPRAIWFGSQFLHFSPDRGESWQIRSPDLTTDNREWQRQADSGGLTRDVTGAENHCTILSIAPSPVQQGVVWVGTDDGRVQVTRDGGRSWRSVEDRIQGLPANTWCPHVEASKFRAGAAFAVFDDHRRGSWTPYLFATADFGETWTSLVTPAIDGYCLVVEQDPVREDLLFLGTEFGLWFTLDGGKQWLRFQHGLPTCSAMALMVHATQGDLVVATHGRSLFIVDDMTPLRSLTPELLASKLHLFPIQDATLWTSRQTPASRFPGIDEFRGENRARGALLHVICTADELAHPDDKVERARKAAKPAAATPPAQDKPPSEKPPGEKPAGEKPAKPEVPKDQIEVEVRDARDQVVRTFRSKVKLGLNRVVWPLERDGERGPARELETDTPEVPPGGREVLPGTYQVTVRFQGESRTQPVVVRADPRVEIAAAAREQKDQAEQRRSEILRPLRDATQRLARSRRDLELVRQRLAVEQKPVPPAEDPHKALREALDTAQKALEAAEDKLWGKKVEQGIVRGEGLVSAVFEQSGALTRTPEPPNPTELLGLQRAEAKVAEAVAVVDEFQRGPLAAFRAAVQASGLSLAPN